MSFIPSIQACPHCSRPLSFGSDAITLKQCSCGKIIRRGEDGALTVTLIEAIEAPFDIIQPGTTGSWNNKRFTVLGRFRTWYKGGIYNYWAIDLEGSEPAYLAEGYGIYAVLVPNQFNLSIPKGFTDDLKPGQQHPLGTDNIFTVDRRQTCYRWEAEAELWMPETLNRFKQADLANSNGTYITVFEFREDQFTVFDVHYLPFSSFGFQGLRPYSNPGKEFRCNECDKTITVKTFPYSQGVACAHCGTEYFAKDGTEFKRTGPPTTDGSWGDIQPGTRGSVKGVEYEVIGFALKEELNAERAQWKEYTLFNEQEGFAFLSEFQGHWVYVRENPNAPILYGKDAEQGFTFNGVEFKLFNAYNYKVKHAKGEFPYNISDTSATHAREFIAPPVIWIREKDTEGNTWFKGEHIPTREIKKGFVFPEGAPSTVGVGTVEPAGFVTLGKLVAGTVIAILLLVFLHLGLSSSKQNRNLLDRDFYFNDSTSQLTFVTEKFNLDKRSSNLSFDIYAPVDNNWFELDATLVSSTTGKEYNVQQGVEYYHGYSDGESWSEGSKTETAYIDQVPAGTYYLQLQGSKETGTWLQGISNFHVTAKYDVTTDRNLWMVIILLLVFAFILYVRARINERRRWYNSPYSPYNTEE